VIGSATRQDTTNTSSTDPGVQINTHSHGYPVTSDSAENKITAPSPKMTSHNNPFVNYSPKTPAFHHEPAPVIAPSPSPELEPVDETLRFVIGTLQKTAGSSPPSLLSQVASSVLNIQQVCYIHSFRFISLTDLQNNGNNTGVAFSRLADHACTLVSSVVLVQEEKRPSPELVLGLDLLARYASRLSVLNPDCINSLLVGS
jgi:hypothetical protein